MTKPNPQQAYFRPRNWERWQKYAKRNPTWIRLYIDINRDPEFMALTPFQRCLALQLWVLYADYGRPLPYDCGFIGRQLTLHCPTVGKALAVLLSSNFIELCDRDVIKPVPRVQSTETETETDPVPIGTDDATAPPSPEADLKARLFNGCLDWLAKQSETTTAKLRPMMGKWIADHGAATVLDAALSAQREGAVEPVAYITRCLRPKSEQYRINSSEVDF